MNTNNTTTNNKVLYQVNAKGNKVAKIGGATSESEATKYLLKVVKKAVNMEQKQGAKYLRTLGVSKNSPLHFDSFNTERLRNLGKIRISDFITKYEESTLFEIINEATAL